MALRYLIVIDFEANCLDGKDIYPQEITEFPAIPIDLQTKTIAYDKTFHHYCKIHMDVTPFATQLTGITQTMSDGGLPFKDVHSKFRDWCRDNGFTAHNSVIVTCGNWDLNTAFPAQCKYSNLTIPEICKQWCNVKRIFKDKYGVKPGSMPNLLKKCGLDLQGRHHSGIDDTKNIARACLKMVNDGANFEVTGYL